MLYPESYSHYSSNTLPLTTAIIHTVGRASCPQEKDLCNLEVDEDPVNQGLLKQFISEALLRHGQYLTNMGIQLLPADGTVKPFLNFLCKGVREVQFEGA